METISIAMPPHQSLSYQHCHTTQKVCTNEHVGPYGASLQTIEN